MQIPLRAARLSAALAVQPSGPHALLAPSGDWLKSAAAYERQASYFKSLYESVVGNLWLTDSYNAYPIAIAFSEHPAWRVLNLFSTVAHLRKMEQGRENIDSAEFFTHFHVSLYRTKVPDTVIIAGPVWRPLGRHSGNYFYTHREQPAVEHFRRLMKVAGEYVRYDDERLRRLAAFRWPVQRYDLMERMKVVTLTIDSLADMMCNGDKLLRQCDLVGLTEWAAFCVQLYAEGADAGLLQALPNMAFMIDHSAAETTQPESALVTMDRRLLSGPTGIKHPVFGISDCCELVRSDENDSPIVMIDAALSGGEVEAQHLQNVRVKFGRFVSALRVQDNAFKMESLFLMREWLTDQIGVLTALSIVVHDDIGMVKEVCYKITRRTLQLSIGNAATIYSYNYEQGVLETYGVYAPWQEKWAAMISPIMVSAGSSESRSSSLSYRAFDTSSTRFCRAYDPTTSRSDPPGEPLMDVPDGLMSGRCGIACPISIFGRPWGVLEVVGARAYQFRWSDKTFAEEIATLLSPFFYNFFFLRHFHALNVAAVGEHSIEKKYKSIARHVAGLFLSESSVLWVKKSSASSDLRLASWCNRPDIDEIYDKAEALDVQLKHNEPTAITQRLIAQGKVWCQGTIGQGALSEEWLGKPYTKSLKPTGVKTAAFIPIQRESGDTIASVTLFSKSPSGWSRDWEPLVRFTKRYLAVLLDAVHTRVDWEREARNAITHDLREFVALMEVSSQKIAWVVERHGLTSLDPEFRNWVSDMKSGREAVEREIEALSSERLEAVERRGVHPSIDLVSKAIEDETPPWIDFRRVFNESFQSDPGLHDGRRLAVKYTGEDRGLFIRMHKFSIQIVLAALYSNAAKYAVPGSDIIAYLKPGMSALYLEVKNLGEPLGPGEKYRIFERGYRGAKAAEKGGRGLGLYVARSICELYKCSLDYREDRSKRSDNYVWHTFIITFVPSVYKIF